MGQRGDTRHGGDRRPRRDPARHGSSRPSHPGAQARARGSVEASAAHRAERAAARQRRERRAAAPLRAPKPSRPAPASRHLAAPGRRPLPSPHRRRRPPRRALVAACCALVAALVAGAASCAHGGAPAAPGTVEQAVAGSVRAAVEGARAAEGPVLELGRAVSAIQDGGHTVGYYLCTADGEAVAAYNADTPFYAASAIKGPYVLSILADPATGAPGGLSDSVANAIVDSDNDSYYRVKSAFGTEAINGWLAEVGTDERLDESMGSYVDLTPRQLAGLWVQALPYIEAEEAQGDSWAHQIFSTPMNSAIGTLEGAVTWSKPGWIEVESTSSTVNAGVVERGGRRYVMAVMTDDGDDFALLDPVIDALDGLEQVEASAQEVAVPAQD